MTSLRIPAGPRVGGFGSGYFSRGGTEGTWVAYMPITALGDLVMLSLAPDLIPYKFFIHLWKSLNHRGPAGGGQSFLGGARWPPSLAHAQ